MSTLSPKDVLRNGIEPSIDPARPAPLVVSGSADEWAALDGASAMGERLASLPIVMIGACMGEVTKDAEYALRAFDLVASGESGEVQASVDGWLEGLQRNPQATAVAAQLLRNVHHTLSIESIAYSALQSGPEHAAWLASQPAPKLITSAGIQPDPATLQSVAPPGPRR